MATVGVEAADPAAGGVDGYEIDLEW